MPIHIAAHCGSFKVLELFIEEGMQLNNHLSYFFGVIFLHSKIVLKT